MELLIAHKAQFYFKMLPEEGKPQSVVGFFFLRRKTNNNKYLKYREKQNKGEIFPWLIVHIITPRTLLV